MTPAEICAAKKTKKPRKETPPRRDAMWQCLLFAKRTALGLSMRDVAEATGMSVTGYFQIEHGADPMLTTARMLADFFGEPVETLWPHYAAKEER